MSLRDELKNTRLYLDGRMGTLLQSRGLGVGELPELWNITHGEVIVDIHKSYFDAGSNIVCSNTFGASRLSYGDELEKIITAAIDNAKRARELAGGGSKYIALDVGPLGRLLKPYGDFEFERAVEVFSETVRIGAAAGADLVFVETMNDSYETKAAVLAAKESCRLPVFASNAYSEDGKLMTGASPAAMVAMLEGLGVDALGVNCSLGPRQLLGVIGEIAKYSSTPILAKPNAGLPESDGCHTVYGVLPEEFGEDMQEMALAGARLLGGCCGTTPEYIRRTVEATRDIPVTAPKKKNYTLVSSYTHCIEIGSKPMIIGERINPTGKKRFKQALVEGDIDYILKEGIAQQEKGADILDVNVGLPGIDEAEMLERDVFELQSVINLPLQLDTSDIAAMERAMRIYNGKAMINSVNGKRESMDAVFPLVKKYGGVVVALTLDESGIPPTAEGRIEIAEKILRTAAEYGIDANDIVFDTLCMSVSADAASAQQTLAALRTVRCDMGINTVLGVSNISFGLPERDIINSNFFAMALESGLSCAIINPNSTEMMKTYHAFLLLHNMDKNCEKYIEFVSTLPKQTVVLPTADAEKAGQIESGHSALANAIIKGLKENAAALCGQMLETHAPLDIVNGEIVPALDIVGKGFEEKTVYLPQLLMSAEAAKRAFDRIKDKITASGGTQEKKAKFVIATVKGDIHDIGKNIVRVLLENYGFEVIDLGKDVEPETVVQTVEREGAPLCGLSALMTTTVPAMEETIKRLRESVPDCRIVVGGAVLNREYAERIGADKYAKDAMETVRYAEKINGELEAAR